MDVSLVCNSITVKLHAALSTGRRHKSSSITCRASPVRRGKTAANFYQVLALESENVGADAIKRAYRSMALRYHPDVCPPSGKEEATRKFIEIQRAYEILSNPALREKYDNQLGLVDLAEEREQQGRRMYPREVWMKQLNELKARSMKRMGKKKKMGGAYEDAEVLFEFYIF